jgi:hypothetical protein
VGQLGENLNRTNLVDGNVITRSDSLGTDATVGRRQVDRQDLTRRTVTAVTNIPIDKNAVGNETGGNRRRHNIVRVTDAVNVGLMVRTSVVLLVVVRVRAGNRVARDGTGDGSDGRDRDGGGGGGSGTST